MQSNDISKLTILVAEPLSLVRAGLCALLATEPDFVLVGETGDGRDVASMVVRLMPCILVLEPDIPGPPAAELVAETMALHPNLKVVLLLAPQRASAAPVLLSSGVSGCFLKSDRPSEFLRGIRSAAAGELAISASVGRLLLGRLNEPRRSDPADALTQREREILSMLTAGLSNKEIAQRLYLSVRTVEVHLRNVYAKLGVRSRLEAVTRPSDD